MDKHFEATDGQMFCSVSATLRSIHDVVIWYHGKYYPHCNYYEAP